MTTTARLVSYVRFSTEEQGRDGLSSDAQRERLAAYVVAHGAELVEEAAKPKERRRDGVINPLLVQLAALASGASALSELWHRYGPLIEAIFR